MVLYYYSLHNYTWLLIALINESSHVPQLYSNNFTHNPIMIIFK